MSESIKLVLRKALICEIAGIGAMAALSLWASSKIPDDTLMPVHWGLSGSADGFAPKQIALWIIPGVMTFASLMIQLKLKSEKHAENLAESAVAMGSTLLAVFVLMFVAHAMIVLGGLGYRMPVPQVIGAGVGLVLILVGCLLTAGAVQRNTTIGVRTPWTLRSDVSWAKTNRCAGIVMIVMGGGTFYGGLTNNMYALAVSIFIGVIVLLTGSFLYSYLLWKKEEQERE